MANNVNEYIDMTVKEIDDRIREAQRFIEFLRQQRKYAIEFKTGSAVQDWYYFVPSRTGGDGHEIKRLGADGSYTCSCPAGRAGRECWAVKGIEVTVDEGGRPNHGVFYVGGIAHKFGANTVSWYRARQNFDYGGWRA